MDMKLENSEMNKQYTKEIEQAKANLVDLTERKDEAIGCTWDELRQKIFTPEEIVASDIRAKYIWSK